MDKTGEISQPRRKGRYFFLLGSMILVALSTVFITGYVVFFGARSRPSMQLEKFCRIERLLSTPRVNWFYAGGTLTETEARRAAGRDSAVTLLFLGVDRRQKERGRTDAIHLLRCEPKGITLFAIPRDTLVDLRDGEIRQKLNHAYAFGGTPLTIRTIEDLLKVHIDGHLEVDMARFTTMLQIARTVTLDGKLIGAEELFRHADGLLDWLRDRSLPGGDLRRLQRQQRFIARALDWTLALYRDNPDVFLAVVKPVLQLLPTDISFAQASVLCEIYSQSPAPEVKDWQPAPWPARTPALAGIGHYCLPGKPAILDTLTGRVWDTTVMPPADSRPAADSATSISDSERFLSVYIADTSLPLAGWLKKWRQEKVLANMVFDDALPGDSGATENSGNGQKHSSAVQKRAATLNAASVTASISNGTEIAPYYIRPASAGRISTRIGR